MQLHKIKGLTDNEKENEYLKEEMEKLSKEREEAEKTYQEELKKLQQDGKSVMVNKTIKEEWMKGGKNKWGLERKWDGKHDKKEFKMDNFSIFPTKATSCEAAQSALIFLSCIASREGKCCVCHTEETEIWVIDLIDLINVYNH